MKLLGGAQAVRVRPEIALTPAGRSGAASCRWIPWLLLGFGPRTPEAMTVLAAAVRGETPVVAAH